MTTKVTMVEVVEQVNPHAETGVFQMFEDSAWDRAAAEFRAAKKAIRSEKAKEVQAEVRRLAEIQAHEAWNRGDIEEGIWACVEAVCVWEHA